MGVTNEFERDLNDTSFLHRPGRIDFRVFQNSADVGDGHPGVQRMFRNYLHEGGMEKDIQLLGFSILGDSVNINNAEMQQLSNIGASVITNSIWSQLNNIEATTISTAQWVFVGEADQAVKQADTPTFGGLSLTGNLVIAANSITGTSVDLSNTKLQEFSNIGSVTINATQWGYLGDLNQALHQSQAVQFAGATLTGNLVLVANSITGTSVDISNAELQQLSLIGSNTISETQWGYLGVLDQNLRQADSPTFVGLTLSANVVTSSTVDGVDVSAHVHSGAGQGGTVDHVNLASKGTNAHSVIDTHLGDYVKHDNIAPFSIHYVGGFTQGDEWGTHWEIACSDTDADVYMCFMVQDIGTYRLKHASYCTVQQASSHAGGQVWIGRIGYGDALAWNVADDQAWTLTQDQYVPRWWGQEYLTDIITITPDTLVYVRWNKDDNMSGRSGNWRVLGWWLERTA